LKTEKMSLRPLNSGFQTRSKVMDHDTHFRRLQVAPAGFQH
jgi:hypothetical protein